MIKELVASLLLSGSIGAKSVVPVTVPVHNLADSTVNYSDVSSKTINGVYNFRDTIDTVSLYEVMDENDLESIEFSVQIDLFQPSGGGQPYLGYVAPVSYNNLSYFVYYIELNAYYDDYVDVTFSCYTMTGYYDTIDIHINFRDDLYSLSDLTWQKEFMFKLNDNVVFNNYSHLIFDCLFTSEINSYFVNYSGYFSFFNISSYGVPFTVFGNQLFDGRNYYDLYTTGTYPQTSYIMSYRDVLQTPYIYHLEYINCSLEYNTKQFLVNWRMSRTSYNNMESIGYFGFVRDTSFDNTTFKDLIFTLVDSPIYMVSSILSFELFGVNLFIALCGLLTIMVILVLVKKFW